MKKILTTLVLLFVFSVNTCALSTSARSAVLINGTTGEVLYEKNSKEHLPMASTTKIMTALLLAEQNTPNKTLVTTKEMVTVEGTSMGLLAGDTVSYNDLLYGLLLASGNDAANTTAFALAGGLENFAKLMNAKAKEIGLNNTNFVTPSGLDAQNHYTTAIDLANLAKYALNNELFAKAAASKSATLNFGNPPYKRTFRNHNRLLSSYEGLIGVKTGFTKKSGRCLVTAARRGEEYLIAVTLKDPNDWQDHTNMLDYGFSILDSYDIDLGVSSVDIAVVGGTAKSITVQIPQRSFGISKETAENIEFKINLPSFVYAPIKQGDVLGNVTYYLNGEQLFSENITASSDIEYNSNDNLTFFEKIYSNFLFLIKQF